MTISYRCGALALALISASPALAKSDTQYWQTVQVSAKVGSRVTISDAIIARTGDARGLYQIVNHLTVGYRLSKHATAALGYSTDEEFTKGHYTLTENRLRQQVSLDGYKIGKVTLSGRLRLEQRWRGGVAGTAWRFRPYLRASVPLIKTVALNLSHEGFIDLNTTAFQKVGGLERMRNAVTLSTPISKRFSVEFGYLEQHGFVRGGPDTDDHVATIQFSASF